ncbi:haloacid dehalogenase type II [Streptomyces monticola]|uniref:Haloacid dehalogenase type II n=1 Tax=Streptomyces monticola TaxID=2666263 RepID=A0ABW2JBF8_9ACTN
MEPMDVDAAVFDVFGTLTDWRAGVTAELAAAGTRTGLRADWAAVADAWRGRYRPNLLKVLGGELPHCGLDELHRIMLDEVLAQQGLDAFTEADRADLVRAWHRLPAWPDAGPGLDRLRESPLLTATLSNGGVGLLARLTKHAGLRFDCVLSAELARSYKPDPKVYLKAAELLAVPPHRLLMVACHPDDLQAAAGAGLRTAYIPRPEWGPRTTPADPPAGVDLVADDVRDLARQLTAQPPARG